MLFSGILSAGLLPLVSCMSYQGSASSKARSAITPRMTLFGDDLETQFKFAPLEFKEICLDCSRENATVQYSCSTKFQWRDPNSVAENNVTSGTCNSGAWEWDGAAGSLGGHNNAPTSYATCYLAGQSYFKARFVDFENSDNFTIEVTHRYQDSQNFTPPYDYPAIFAMPTFNLSTIMNTNLSIVAYSPGTVYAKVSGLSD